LAIIKILIQYESYFKDLLNLVRQDRLNFDNSKKDHYRNYVLKVAKMDAWADEIIMIAISLIVDRQIIYLNIIPRIEKKEDDLIVTRHEENRFIESGIASLCNLQAERTPILLLFHQKHYTSIKPYNYDFFRDFQVIFNQNLYDATKGLKISNEIYLSECELTAN